MTDQPSGTSELLLYQTEDAGVVLTGLRVW
jgi:hypothetical protein